MNEAVKPLPRRRWLWPCRNDLMRPADWLQAVLLRVVIIVGAVFLPIALAVGSETYANQSRLAEEQSQTRYQVTVTLIQDAPPERRSSRGEAVSGTSDVQARWTMPNGTEGTGMVKAGNGLKSGATVQVWVDVDGKPSTQPLTHDQAAFSGVVMVIGIWGGIVGLLWGLYWLVRFGLNRGRDGAWDREWARVDRDWNHPAGSGT